ncbi:hypothetical protein MMC15_000187 [Xylographa vitiligo]|nr:hypothetical protein [Xylographa vitiligo]
MSAASFQKAAAEVKGFEVLPPDTDQLKLYGLFKVASNNNIADAPKPGAFDFKGKYKYNEWKKNVDAGMTAPQAQQQYVKYVDELRPKYEKK